MLAGIMTAFGSPTGAVPIGGYGEFDGVMLEAFKRPRIEGTFKGERFRAWDVVWGTRPRGPRDREQLRLRRERDADRTATRRFAPTVSSRSGYPRTDGGDEIDARVRLTRRPLVDLRHAFELDDYPIEGTGLRRIPPLRTSTRRRSDSAG